MAGSLQGADGSLIGAVAAELDDASVDEAAAIATAIDAHLSDRERAAAAAAASAAADDSGPAWEGREWNFAGRLAKNARDTRRIPRDAPANAWAAAGRSDRF